MFGIYSHLALFSYYLCNKNLTISYFIILISNRDNFVVRGSSSLLNKIFVFQRLFPLYKITVDL